MHTQKIEMIKYSQLINRDTGAAMMASSVLTVSEDKTLKVWDRQSGKLAFQMKHRGQPFFSVETNGSVIVAGTNEDVVFWDVRNTKVPMEILDESHNLDVTQVRFHPDDNQKVLSCGTDCLLNYFEFEGKSTMKEEESIDTVYCSEQAFLDCGFIPGTNKAWALTSLQIEIVDLETAELYTKVTKFPHDWSYIVGVEQLNN